MKSTIAIFAITVIATGYCLGDAAFAQRMPGVRSSGHAPYAVSQAGCDACDAYGNSIEPGLLGGGGYGDGGYGGGGYGTYGASGGYDQCGPHYFDFAVDFLFWKRDEVTGPSQPFSSEGLNGQKHLTLNGLEFENEPGVKFTGRYDLGPATIVEAIYFGTFNWQSGELLRSVDFPPNTPAQIFSFYTNYGLGGVGFPDPAQRPDTDRADIHRLDYSTELHSAEINWRQYWVADDPRISGTYMMGARYVRLTEDLLFYTQSALGSMHNNVDTENDLVGIQIGADGAFCVRQGLCVVVEGKAGLFNNRAKQNTRVVATSLTSAVLEGAESNHAAFVAEGSVGFVADILPSLSVRGGYQVLLLDAVALAGDNFNTADPFAGTARNVTLDDASSVLFHGLYGGLEYIW